MFKPLNERYQEPVFEAGNYYIALYPFGLIDKDNLERAVWKTEQTFSKTSSHIPMYSELECVEDGKADFKFKNLGGLLRLTVKGSSTIRSIRVSAAEDEKMSGPLLLMVDDNNETLAVVKDSKDAVNYIILDCGEDGVSLSNEGTDFYISMPCRCICEDDEIVGLDGYSDVTVTLTDMDGKTCAKKLSGDKKLVIERSKITTATFTASEFKENIPEGALPGAFGVSATKTVYFSQGNLYYDGSKFNFEANQYDFRTYAGKNSCINGASSTTGTPTGHWGLFGWVGASSSFTGDAQYGVSTSTTASDYGNVASEALKSDWGNTIDNSGTWRTLSTAEWQYLFNNHVKVWGQCNSVNGYFIAPDGFAGDAYDLSSLVSDWTAAEAAGIVFLPAAGFRSGSDVGSVGDSGIYWSSTALGSNRAYFVYFDSSDVYLDNLGIRYNGFSVRLVTESK